MPFVNLSKGLVHYTECGQGLPLVLLHANPGDSQDFEAVMPVLSAHYRVLALDWPGYGQSPLPAHSQAIEASFFYEVLHEFVSMLDLPPALFIGNSLGGHAAAKLAIESPEKVRGLVLVSPGGFNAQDLISRIFCNLQSSSFALSPYRFASWYLRHRTSTTQAMLERASTSQAMPPRIALNRAVWRSFLDPAYDLRQTAGAIKAPTLLLFGKDDPVLPAHKDGRVAAKCIPAAKFVAMPSGHAPFAEAPDLFLGQVKPFLAAC